ncbi:MAG: hypothetical protein JWP06_634 [Candidatus Saccharibacteria bacterium]|nr:hypothetical protein [Candidatus Saccharibacteria bacterium]
MRLIDEDTEKEILDRLPDVVKAIEEVKRNKADYLMMMLDAFAGEPELLYKVLWFAYSNGVAVLIVPSPEKP